MIDIVPENATGSSEQARMIRAQYQAAGVSYKAPLVQAHGEDWTCFTSVPVFREQCLLWRRPDMAAKHSDDFKREAVRVATHSGLIRRQVASDLGVGFSTLGR